MGFNLLKAVGGAVGGFVRGGVTGAIIGGVRGGLGRRGRSTGFDPTRPDSTVVRRMRLGPYQRENITTYFDGQPVDGGGTTLPEQPTGFACPAGFRLNKSTYVTRGGGTSRWPMDLIVHPKKSTCVKRRKLNAGNGRAATRAVRRLVSFYGLSQRVAKQLRRAASKAHIRGARRGQRQLTRGGVEVVNVE